MGGTGYQKLGFPPEDENSFPGDKTGFSINSPSLRTEALAAEMGLFTVTRKAFLGALPGRVRCSGKAY